MSRVEPTAAPEAPAVAPVAAKSRPVGRPRKEINTGDMKTRELPTLGGDVLVHEAEPIVLLESSDVSKDYLKELAFMEEWVTIRLERTGEKNAAKWVQFGVNGVIKWLQPGVPVRVQRKYVEVLARSVPYDVETEVEDATVAYPRNEIVRNARAKYPFSVIEDKNPRGAEWLTKVMATS